METFIENLRKVSEASWSIYGRWAIAFIHKEGLLDQFYKFVVSELGDKPLDKPETEK